MNKSEIETKEILNNKKLMRKIKTSVKQIKNGKGVSVNELED